MVLDAYRDELFVMVVPSSIDYIDVLCNLAVEWTFAAAAAAEAPIVVVASMTIILPFKADGIGSFAVVFPGH